MICAECENEKPDLEFVSRYGKLRKLCETCSERHRVKIKKRRQKEKSDAANVPEGFKKCFSCFKVKEIVEFKVININNGNEYGINCFKCSGLQRKASLKWKKENPEQTKQHHDNYVAKNKEKLSEYDRARKDLRALTTKSWIKNNRTKVNSYNSFRRAKRSKATPKWLTAPQLAEIEGYYLFCSIFPGFHVDHIMPLLGKNVCGLHVPWNLQTLPAVENMRKGNRIEGIPK